MDLSLLFRLKGDSSGGVKAVEETRAAVNSLRQSFGPQLTQTVTVANKTFADLGQNISGFVAQRLPLASGAFLRLTDNLRTLSAEGPKTEKALAGITKSIESIASKSGKSIPEIATFLSRFVQIEGQSQRSGAATEFFGASLATKLLPQLEKTGAEVGAVSGEAAAMGASFAALAGPIGIAIIALAALAAGVVVVVNKLADLTVQTAAYQGQLFDLSQQTGVSVEILNDLEIALSKVGGNLGSATQALIAFQRQLDEAQDFSSKAGQTFARLGISTNDTETAFRDTLKALAAMPEGFAQTNAAAELFGARGGKQILAVLKELHGDIDAAVEDLGNLGKVTTEQARKADEFNDALRDVQILLRGASAVLVREVIPLATDALKDLQTVLKDNEAAFKALGAAIDLAATATGAFVKGSLFTLNAFLATHRVEFELTAAVFERIANALKTIRNTPESEPLKGVSDGLRLLQQIQEIQNKGLKPFNLEDIFGLEKAAKAAQDAAKSAFSSEIDELQAAITERNQAFQFETENIKRELQKRSIEFKNYYDQQKAANERQVNDTLTNLQTEREAVARALAQGVIDANEAAQKRRQIDSQARQAKRDAAREDQRLEDEKLAFKIKQDQATIDVLRATVETQLRILAIGDERQIASIRALAALRVKSEEDAERQILRIRLAALDRDKEIMESQRALLEEFVAKKLGDPEENLKQLASVNLRLRALVEERAAIEDQGNRDIDEGRRQDLQNEREYADELEEINKRIRDIERDSAEEVIRLMVIHFASRKDIIRARLQADLDDERARHEQANETIRNLKLENSQSNKTKEEKLETERQLNQLLEAELERHLKREEEIKTGAKQEAKDADSIGRLGIDIDTLNQFKTVIEDSIIPLGEILRNTFQQVADAIGQTVANWVLLGETGPAVGRKLLAVALANLAREATVNAIKELALGFATLFFNPAESAAHFTSAALWGSIAGVSAIAGRGVAGDLFKSKSAGGGAGGGGSNGSGELNPLSLARNAGPGAPQQIAPQIQPQKQIIELHIKSNDSHIVRVIKNDYANAGPIREVIVNDGGHEF